MLLISVGIVVIVTIGGVAIFFLGDNLLVRQSSYL